jgi:hypothetical protein
MLHPRLDLILEGTPSVFEAGGLLLTSTAGSVGLKVVVTVRVELDVVPLDGVGNIGWVAGKISRWMRKDGFVKAIHNFSQLPS